MSKNLLNILLSAGVGIIAASGSIIAQAPENTPKQINFNYSQNPKTKAKFGTENSNQNDKANTQLASTGDSSPSNAENSSSAQITADKSVANRVDKENTTIAQKMLEVTKRLNLANISPTEIYKVGVGDVLFISLQNAPPNSSTYFTVLNDGTIDYPLAGQMVSVTGLTTEEIEDLLKGKIKLFENPQVAVKVREASSHSITVLGLVEKAGEKFLPREAMPLYYVRAEAVVQSKANQAVIKHLNAGSEIVDLNEPKNDNILIFPGDIIEFKAQENKETVTPQMQFFYIGGNIMSVGQKDFHQGLTLTQAILVSGGLRKPIVKKVTIRRKNTEGLLVATEVNYKAVLDGKEPDPTLEAGDTIEVGN